MTEKQLHVCGFEIFISNSNIRKKGSTLLNKTKQNNRQKSSFTVLVSTPRSREGYSYIINFVNEHSRMIFVNFLRSKDEASTALKNLTADVSPIGKIKEIHSDNGAEYMSKSFQRFLSTMALNKHQLHPIPFSRMENQSAIAAA